MKSVVGSVINRWYKIGLLKFNSWDDGSDDLLLRDEIVKTLIDNIDPTWCDCPEGYPHIGIGKYKHLPSCRYGVIEDYLYS